MDRKLAEKMVCDNIKKNIGVLTGISMDDMSFEEAKKRTIAALGESSFERAVQRVMDGTNTFQHMIQEFIDISNDKEKTDEKRKPSQSKFEA